MGLFFKKKPKPEEKKFPEFPSYEPQIKPFEYARLPPIEELPAGPVLESSEMPELDIPVRKKNFSQIPEREKPLFVKIENYNLAVRTIKEIKNSLNEAEKILRNLARIKSEEEQELNVWQADIEKIKSRLLEIDNRLFEFENQ